MDKPVIARDFRFWKHFRAPVFRPLLPLMNLCLRPLEKAALARVPVPRRSLSIPAGDGYAIPALLFEPRGLSASAPCLILYHGGGFVFRASPSHCTLAGAYAQQVPCKVLLVDYRLAPKYPYPVPLQDCLAAYLWLRRNAARLGIGEDRIGIGGDSAGGLFSAAVTLMLRDAGLPEPVFQMLLYPCTDRRNDSPSMHALADAPMWNRDTAVKVWKWYLPSFPPDQLAYVSPAEAASHRDLPDAYIESAEYDCLHDEAITYAGLLRAAGNSVVLNETHGTIHGYDTAIRSPIVWENVERRVKFMKKEFEKESQH